MSYTPGDIAATAKALQSQAERLAEQIESLVLMTENIDVPVIPDEPDPLPGVAVRVLEVVETDGERVRIRFGFDDNRPGQLLIEAEDGDGWTSTPETSWKYGAPGNEHHQWIEDLTPGTYRITVWTRLDDHTDWIQADGEHLELVIEEPVTKVDGPAFITPDGAAFQGDMAFEWTGPDGAVYDLIGYTDAARTIKATDSAGRAIDTAGIGTATSHTFTGAKPGTLYMRLYSWRDNTYSDPLPHADITVTVAEREQPKVVEPSGPAYEMANAGFDLNLSRESIWYTTKNIELYGRVTTEAYYHRNSAFYGLTLAHEVTGDRRYLQKGVDMALAYIKAGIDMDGDGFHDWIWGHKSDPGAINHDHYEWRSAMGIAMVAAELHRSGASVSPSNALATMREYLERQVWDKWWKHGSQPKGESSLQGNTGSGRVGRTGVITVTLHMLTGESKYYNFLSDRITGMAQAHIDSRDPVTNTMNITAKFDGSDFSYDVSHCEDILMWYDFARRYGYDLGGRLDDAFYQSLADSITKVIWPGNQRFATYRWDGSDMGSHGGVNEAYGVQQVCSLILLAGYSDELRSKAIKHASDPTIADPPGNITHEKRMLYFAALMRATAGNQATAKVPQPDGEWTPEMADSSSLSDVLGDAKTYAHDTANRVTVSAGNLMQRFVPTSKGSHHDQGAARIADGFREYTVEQEVKFAADFDAVKGGKFGFGLGGGTHTSGGTDDPAGWTARLMFRPSKLVGMMQAVIYSYQSNRRAKASGGKRYGDDNPVGNLRLGDWHGIRFVVGLNSKAGSSDGYLYAYLNGVEALEITGIQWQGKGTPGEAMRAIYTAFFGGNDASWAPDSDQYMWIRNVRVSWRNP